MGRYYNRLLKPEQLESRRPLAADLAALDVNDDMSVTALDALFVINEINQRTDGNVSTAEAEGRMKCDTNGDGVVTPVDVLNIVNQINTGLIAVPTDNAVTTTSEDTTSQITTSEEVVSDPTESSEDSADDKADDTSDDTSDSSDQTDETNGGDNDDVVSEPTDDGSSDDTSDDTSDDDSSDDDSSDNTNDEETGTDDESECEREGATDEVARRGFPPIRGHHVRGDLFANLDANGDGVLSNDEVPDGLWDRLMEADADASDTVTKEELQAYRKARRAAAVEAIFEQLDTDASGTITSTDVSRLTWRFLARADADNDGAITIDELLAAPLPRRF